MNILITFFNITFHFIKFGYYFLHSGIGDLL